MTTREISNLYLEDNILKIDNDVYGHGNQFIYITNEEKIENKNYVLSSLSIGVLYLDGIINTVEMLAEEQWKKVILTNDPKLIADGVQELTEEQLKEIVSVYPLDYAEVKADIKAFDGLNRPIANAVLFDDYTKSVYSLSFSAENIIDKWLDKNGTKEINKKVGMEAERYSKLISDFEILEGITSNQFDSKDWIRFDRFVERREKENEEDLNNKDNWEFERSSGYAGYRNEVTGDWIYEKDYLEKFGEKDKTAEKENYRRVFTQENGWQDERIYTEEEVLKLLLSLPQYNNNYKDQLINQWFEQFKK